MNEQPADLRELLAALFRHAPDEPRPGDETPGEIADLILGVMQPKLDQRDAEIKRLKTAIGPVPLLDEPCGSTEPANGRLTCTLPARHDVHYAAGSGTVWRCLCDEPETSDLAEELAEMTRLRDNALRATAHADQSIHIDLEGILADGLHGQWGDDHAPDDLVQTIVGIVRPVVAHATKRAEQAEAANARVRQLCNLTIAASCRVQAIDQARDTLAVLDQTEASTTTCSRCNNNPADRESSLCESCDTEITAIREFVANLDPRKKAQPTTLNWHYGPTATDPDPGKMWHQDCGQEVMHLEDGHICGCGAQDNDQPTDSGSGAELNNSER